MDFIFSKKFNIILIALISFNGLIVGLIKLLGLNFGLSPVNLIILFSVPILLLSLFFQVSKSGELNVISKLITLLIFLFFLKIIYLATQIEFTNTDFIIYMMYFSGYLFFVHFARLNSVIIVKYIDFIIYCFLGILFIFWIQYFFHARLPSAITEIPNLFNEIGVEKYTRELTDIIIYRPNGLIGNPISLGFYLNTVLAIILFRYKNNRSTKKIILIILLFFMITLLFSRANFMLMFIQIITFFFISTTKISSLLFKFAIILFFLSILAIVFSSQFSFLLDRLTGKDEFAQASNLEHINDYLNALKYIYDNPILGISPQINLDNNIITDGAIFSFILNSGVIIFMTQIILVFYVLKILLKASRKNKSILILFVFIVLVNPYCFLNSAILNKGLFLFYHIFLGISINYAVTTINKTDKKYQN